MKYPYDTNFCIIGDEVKLKQLFNILKEHDSIQDVAKALNVELNCETYDTDDTCITGVRMKSKTMLVFNIYDTSYIPYDALDEICKSLDSGIKLYFQEDPEDIPNNNGLMSRPAYDAEVFTEEYGLYYAVDEDLDATDVFKTRKDVYEFIKKELRERCKEDGLAAIEEEWKSDDPDDFIAEADNWGYRIVEYDHQNG